MNFVWSTDPPNIFDFKMLSILYWILIFLMIWRAYLQLYVIKNRLWHMYLSNNNMNLQIWIFKHHRISTLVRNVLNIVLFIVVLNLKHSCLSCNINNHNKCNIFFHRISTPTIWIIHHLWNISSSTGTKNFAICHTDTCLQLFHRFECFGSGLDFI